MILVLRLTTMLLPLHLLLLLQQLLLLDHVNLLLLRLLMLQALHMLLVTREVKAVHSRVGIERHVSTVLWALSIREMRLRRLLIHGGQCGSIFSGLLSDFVRQLVQQFSSVSTGRIELQGTTDIDLRTARIISPIRESTERVRCLDAPLPHASGPCNVDTPHARSRPSHSLDPPPRPQ